MGTLNALFIHGVGEQEKTFAKDAVGWISAGRSVKPVVCWWAPFADKLQHQFAADAEAEGSAMGPLQDLTVGTLSDALVYQANPAIRKLCWDLLDINVARFKGAPFTCFAHSLGCLIFTDWLRQRPAVRGVRLVSMGCNIGLFYQGREWDRVPQLDAPNAWVNVYTKRDMLGFGMRKLVGPGLLNHRVELGGFWGWTGLSHMGYWGSKRLWSKALPKLLAL